MRAAGGRWPPLRAGTAGRETRPLRRGSGAFGTPISAKFENFFPNLSTVSLPGASNRQNRETEVVPIEDLSFFQCFRSLIESCRLSPEASESQLTEILRRVREARPAGPSGDGRRNANPIHAGGTNQ